MSGCFIAIEGLDGSGGTTQVQKLCSALGAHATAEPSDGPVGQLIRQALRNEVPLGDGVLPLLFAADRTDHLVREIEPLLAQGGIVVSDRYYASSLAYQSLVAPLGDVARINEHFRAPDVTIFLDLSPESCIERISARGEQRERFEHIERLLEISAAYGAALALLASRGEHIVHVDASASVEDVHARVMEAVKPCLP
jgi:dTMP kinase